MYPHLFLIVRITKDNKKKIRTRIYTGLAPACVGQGLKTDFYSNKLEWISIEGNRKKDNFICDSEKIIPTCWDNNPFLIRKIIFNPRSIVFCFVWRALNLRVHGSYVGRETSVNPRSIIWQELKLFYQHTSIAIYDILCFTLLNLPGVFQQTLNNQK